MIDCTNPLKPDLSGLTVRTTTSVAERIASWAPAVKVVKAFNTIDTANFGNAQFGAQRADGFHCGDAAPKSSIWNSIEDAGLNLVDVGTLRNARWLEAMARLWIDLAVNQKQSAGYAFKLLHHGDGRPDKRPGGYSIAGERWATHRTFLRQRIGQYAPDGRQRGSRHRFL